MCHGYIIDTLWNHLKPDLLESKTHGLYHFAAMTQHNYLSVLHPDSYKIVEAPGF